MNLILEIIFWSILSFALLFIFIYLTLPWIFKRFVSPFFNTSYVYKSSDFVGKEKQIPKQNNIPEIYINPNNGLFKISFGENKSLDEGIFKLHTNGKIYSNLRRLGKKIRILDIMNVSNKESEDILGNFEETKMEFEIVDLNKSFKATIKQYKNQNYVIFKLTFPHGLNETDTGKFHDLITAFPSFINKSPNRKVFTFREEIFCPPSRNLKATTSPVLFYDNDLNCFIISPLDGFLNTAITKDKDGRINCGIQGKVTSLPKGFTQKFIVYFGKGINKSMETLGDILLKYHDAKRKDLYSDIVCSYLGFWTDNGAFYYYKTERGLNYEDTMVAIREYFEKHDIPICYYNFDSWWYLKHTNKIFTTIFRPIVRLLGGGLYGNTIRWETDPEKFTTSLETFYNQKFQKPITAHNRRWDSRSPYLENYEFITHKNHACPLKKDFWIWLMEHAKKSGIFVYEQDWMNNQINSIPYLRENVDSIGQWLNSMAIAAKKQDIDIFYCMQTPGITLYSIKHPNITMTRCSGDYNHRWPLTYRYVHSTQYNILLHAVGLISHPDVFRSRSMEGVKFRPFGEKHPKFKCLYQNLNAGPICPGDKKENINWPLLNKTCRNDGLLFKPDKPLTANDLMFKSHKKYYLCDTYIKRSDYIWRFILVTNIWPNRVKETFIIPKELGYQDKNYILFDYFENSLVKIRNDQKIEIGDLEKYGYKYFIFNPIFENGIALIGCVDKFIPCSKKQITEINSEKSSLNFTLEDLKNTQYKILLYSETKPKKIIIDSEELQNNEELNDYWIYDDITSTILLHIKYNDESKKNIEIII